MLIDVLKCQIKGDICEEILASGLYRERNIKKHHFNIVLNLLSSIIELLLLISIFFFI